MFWNPLAEYGRELEEQFSEEMNIKRKKHTDLYKLDANSMRLVYQAFSRKVKKIEDKNERAQIYKDYANIDIIKLQKKGKTNAEIRKKIFLNLITNLIEFDKKKRNTFIDDMFDPDFTFELE